MKKFISLLALVAFSIQFVNAQNKTLTGIVMSVDKNKPLVGATVSVKGTTQSTITDIDGKFQINVSGNAESLEVSYVRMKTKEVTIDLLTDFIVKLEPNESKMGINGDLSYSLFYLWRGQNKCDNPFQLNLNAYAYGAWIKAQGVSGSDIYSEINLSAGYTYRFVSLSVTDYYWNKNDVMDFYSYEYQDNNGYAYFGGIGAFDYFTYYKRGHRFETSLNFDFSKLVKYLDITFSANCMFYYVPKQYDNSDKNLAKAFLFSLDYNLPVENIVLKIGASACYDNSHVEYYDYSNSNAQQSYPDSETLPKVRERVYGNENDFDFIDVHFCMDYKYHFTKRFGVDLNAMLMYNPVADKPYINAGAGILF